MSIGDDAPEVPVWQAFVANLLPPIMVELWLANGSLFNIVAVAAQLTTRTVPLLPESSANSHNEVTLVWEEVDGDAAIDVCSFRNRREDGLDILDTD